MSSTWLGFRHSCHCRGEFECNIPQLLGEFPIHLHNASPIHVVGNCLHIHFYLLRRLKVSRLNNNDSLIVSDSDVSVNEYCCQVLVPVHVGHERLKLCNGHGVVHGRGVASVGGWGHPQSHVQPHVGHERLKL